MGLFSSVTKGLDSFLDTATGGLLSGVGSQLLSQDYASAQSARQMRFQERMSNTQYQRAVEDLKAAGINPMLAAKFGGSTTPSGAMATVGSNIAKGMSDVAMAAQQRAATKYQINSAEKARYDAMHSANLAKKEAVETRLRQGFEKYLNQPGNENLKDSYYHAEATKDTGYVSRNIHSMTRVIQQQLQYLTEKLSDLGKKGANKSKSDIRKIKADMGKLKQWLRKMEEGRNTVSRDPKTINEYLQEF